jgi:tRNA(Ile)-lysidine synthase
VSANLSELFLTWSRSKQLFTQVDKIIVAISGGLDSIVLTHLFNSIQQPVVLAHCNFQLRGDESHRDEQFVRDLAEKWKLPLQVEQYDTEAYASEKKVSIQVAARQLRYDFFERLRMQLASPGKRVLIATAHHANDAVETMLLHLFRGTGIDGLRGIPVKNGPVIRPLLFATRQDIERYAGICQLSWVEDSSNLKEDYARNYIRHTIIPAINGQFPTVINNLVGTIEKMNDAAGLYHEMVDIRLKKMVVLEGEIQKIPVKKLEKIHYSNTLLWEWIKPFGFSDGQVGEVLKLCTAGNGSYIASASHRIIRNRAWLLLVPATTEKEAPFIVMDELPVKVKFGNGMLMDVKNANFIPSLHAVSKQPNEVHIDAGLIKFPLILRPWKPGDYFYPLGMVKKKKVARFLIDQKVSPLDKGNTWVLESDRRIIWLVGYRIDDRFKITNKTASVISITVS